MLQLEAQLADRDVTIALTEEAAKWLIERGYDEQMGARPMARVIQEHIKKPLADEVLFGRLKSGGHVRVVVVTDENGRSQARLRISRRPGHAAAGKASGAAPRQEAPLLAAAQTAGRRPRRQFAATPRLGAEGAIGQGLAAAGAGCSDPRPMNANAATAPSISPMPPPM